MNLIGIYILKSNMTHVEASYAPDEMIKHSENFYCPENSGEILNEMAKHCSSFNYSTSSLSRDRSFSLPLEHLEKAEVIVYARILENVVDRLQTKSGKVKSIPQYSEKANNVTQHLHQTGRTDLTAKPRTRTSQTSNVTTPTSKKICWYFRNSTCKFGSLCWNSHSRVKKVDEDKKNPKKKNRKLKSRNTLEKSSEKSKSLQQESVLDSTDFKLSIEENSSEGKSKETVFDEVTDTVEFAQAEPLDKKQNPEDLFAQKKSTVEEPTEGITSCPGDDTSTEDPDFVKRKDYWQEDEQDKRTESKQPSELTSIKRKKNRKSKKCCKENDIQQSEKRNHAEINNVISDKDAADKDADVALHWINEKLKTRHKSLGELKDGKSLQKVHDLVIYKEPWNCTDDPWNFIFSTMAVDLDDYDIDEDLIRTGERKEIAKVIHWLMKKEKDEDE